MSNDNAQTLDGSFMVPLNSDGLPISDTAKTDGQKSSASKETPAAMKDSDISVKELANIMATRMDAMAKIIDARMDAMTTKIDASAGKQRVFMWCVGVIGTIFIAFFALFYNTLPNKIDANYKDLSAKMDTINIALTNRIDTLSAKMDANNMALSSRIDVLVKNGK
ncbi:MAG: hypothetical protein LBT38_03180 [Deltaproteobacteria bacterium]|nr:hypothetical protein [Deltaproteobacteria bacterium]